MSNMSRGLSALLFALLIGSLVYAAAPPHANSRLGEWAARLPELPVEQGRVGLPLTHEKPFKWNALGSTRITRNSDHLNVQYSVEQGKPNAASLLIRPGTLRNLQELRIDVECTRALALTVSLRSAERVVYSFRPRQLEPGRRQILHLDPEELGYDPMQGGAPDPGAFDLDQAIVITLLDISGFIAPNAADTTWKIFKIEAVRGTQGSEPQGHGGDDQKPDSPADRENPAPREKPRASHQQFFEALNRDPSLLDSARRRLTAAFVANPENERTTLLLALAHLWSATEGPRTDVRTLEHLLLSESYFDHVAALSNSEDRLPSWRVPVKRAVLRIKNGDIGETQLEPLREAFRSDPCFHGFALGYMNFPQPNGSPGFLEGLDAVRSTAQCSGDDPSIQNLPRWPHNLEGFSLLLSDYEHRAGNVDGARQVLERAQRLPSYSRWPYRTELERRLEELRSPNPTPPPARGWMQGAACQVCHLEGS